MRQYRLKAEMYFGAPPGAGVPFSEFSEHLRECEPTIGQLICRYNLNNKKILSLGAGAGFEEYWMANAGCELTLVDISPEIETYVASLPLEAEAPTLTYVFADAGVYVSSLPEPEFDILYVSSFHPDELRREQIQAEFCKTRTAEQARLYVTWPAATNPYHESIVKAFTTVKEGGLIILQHYRGGAYLSHNAHYLRDMANQLHGRGAILLEVFCFRRSPAHALVVACKTRDDATARTLMQDLRKRPTITTFHGRYHDIGIKTDVVKVFELENSTTSVANAFPGA